MIYVTTEVQIRGHIFIETNINLNKSGDGQKMFPVYIFFF